nr:hypothetical protein [uncultured Sphingomonas sp.]
MNPLMLLPVALFAVTMGITLWLMPRVLTRAGLKITRVEQPLARKVTNAVLLTAAIIVGLWIVGADPTDPGVILMGLVAVSFAMFVAFRPVKRA